jgi:hypothetical protein
VTRSYSVSGLRSEFDGFLLAPFGEDRTGIVSVLSALARMNIDPWEEAEKLARLPSEAAIRTLASQIDALSGGPLTCLDPEKTAARLIALLPCPTESDLRPRKMRPAVAALVQSPVVSWVTCCLIFMLFVLVVRAFRPDVIGPTQIAKAPMAAPNTSMSEQQRNSSK